MTEINMLKLNRPIRVKDIAAKGFPFACENCGNKPTPEKVVEHSGSCEICGDTIVAYTVDTAEYIIQMGS
jgi:transcription initiation factor IIE alpha subunit